MTHYFGAHTIDVGGIHMAVKRAARSNMRALQVFTAKPQFYNEKIGVRPERAERFREALAASAQSVTTLLSIASSAPVSPSSRCACASSA